MIFRVRMRASMKRRSWMSYGPAQKAWHQLHDLLLPAYLSFQGKETRQGLVMEFRVRVPKIKAVAFLLKPRWPGSLWISCLCSVDEFWVSLEQLHISPLWQGTRLSCACYPLGTPLYSRAATSLSREEILAHAPVLICTVTFVLQSRGEHLAFAKQRTGVSVFALRPAISF